MLQTSTLRPGLLVSLKTTISGGVKYDVREIQPETILEDGAQEAAWETRRLIEDPKEHEAATQARSKARQAVSRICSSSNFGLLCPEANAKELEKAIVDARAIAEDFNGKSRFSRVGVYVITGRIAPDDVEAVRSINSELRELLEQMEKGVETLDAKAIRDAAARAVNVGRMLSPETEARVKIAVDTARQAARKIVKAGETAAQEVDRAAIRKIAEARTAFLDLGDAKDVQAPTTQARALDMEAGSFTPAAPKAAVVQVEI